MTSIGKNTRSKGPELVPINPDLGKKKKPNELNVTAGGTPSNVGGPTPDEEEALNAKNTKVPSIHTSTSSKTRRARLAAIEAEEVKREAELKMEQLRIAQAQKLRMLKAQDAEKQMEEEMRLLELEQEQRLAQIEIDEQRRQAEGDSSQSGTKSERGSVRVRNWINNNNQQEEPIPTPGGDPFSTVQREAEVFTFNNQQVLNLQNEFAGLNLTTQQEGGGHVQPSNQQQRIQGNFGGGIQGARGIQQQPPPLLFPHSAHPNQGGLPHTQFNTFHQQPDTNLARQMMTRNIMKRNLSSFNGNPEDWISFKEEFKRSTSICGIYPEENLSRLKQALQGKALEAVRSLLSNPCHVDRIMSILEMRFGCPKQVIESVLNKTLKTPAPKEGDFDSTIAYANSVESLVATIEGLSKPALLEDERTKDKLLLKLPYALQIKWAQWIRSNPSQANLRWFSAWLNDEALLASALPRPSTTSTSVRPDRRDRQRGGGGVYSTTEEPQQEKCQFCERGPHHVSVCRSFAKEPQPSRYEWVNLKKMCFCCMSGGHVLKECPKRKECGKDGCSSLHHPLLHREIKSNNVAPKVPWNKYPKYPNPPNNNGSSGSNNNNARGSSNKGSEEVVGYTTTQERSAQILLRVAKVTLVSKHAEVDVLAFFDEGSSVTLLDERVATDLRLKGPKSSLRLNWFNEAMCSENSRRVDLGIRARGGKDIFKLESVRTVRNLNLPVQSLNIREMSEKWRHLRGIRGLPTTLQGRPTILIGQDNHRLILPQRSITGPLGAPTASSSMLGWTLHGKVNGGKEVQNVCAFIQEEVSVDTLHQLVKASFSTEEFGVKHSNAPLRSKEEERAVQLFNQVTRRVGKRKWETGLLWRSPDVTLPESYENAMYRLTRSEKKMDRDVNYADQYVTQMEDNISKGYARKLSSEEAKEEGERTWYLPHFGVTHPQKPGKLRLVFDAAAESRGVSLNSKLFKGPDILNSLPGTLFKFREGAIAFSGDIREMFPQIKMRVEDADSQRFLWRGMDRQRPPDIYRMEVVIFGASSSPFSAQEVLHANAREYEREFPEACKAILYRHYMDDYLDSVSTEEEAINLIQQVKEVHQRGGFEILKWISSSSMVLESVPLEERAPGKKEIGIEPQNPTERVLGLVWDPKDDVFNFNCKFVKMDKAIVNGEKVPTKREMLSMVMSLFDPLGFISTFTMKAKVILQEVWRKEIGWDDEISPEIMVKWRDWLAELRKLNEIAIPRCYSVGAFESAQIQLHVFCDASEKAFCAVAYLRIKRKNGKIDTSFVMARTRVAPLKPMSIPRLELQAAVMGARLAVTLREEHRIIITSIHFWTDSRTVLCWLRADARIFKMFVAHRIGEILETSEVTQWRWVPTKENVADDATRESRPSDFSAESRWWHGPAFLKREDSEWPEEEHQVKEVPNDPEVKLEFVGVASDLPPFPIKVQDYSTFLRLIRITAWVFRFIVSSKRERPSSKGLQVQELAAAESFWVKRSQKEAFPQEVKAIGGGEGVRKDSRLKTLAPFIKDGVLRLGGRLERSPELSEEARAPAILDPNHPFTRLLIHHHHVLQNHHGFESVLNEIRTKYWIINARTAIKSAIARCQHCKNERAIPAVPEMAPLPAVRVSRQSRPFLMTGMDYFGPMEVTIGRRHEKRYGVLFTCLTMRAVHLEIANSLTTDSCINAIRRFIARRGKPITMYSDNGTNLRGADTELRKSIHELSEEEIQDWSATCGFEWRFIPPGAPHMGGAWERMVRSVKVALKATLMSRAPKEEVLSTLFAEAEFSVNSHPLTYVSSSPEDPESLTPNHFLIGPNCLSKPPGVFTNEEEYHRKQWREAQMLANHFWSRWVCEYLPTLAPRKKWTCPERPVKIGDVVVIVDGNLPRNTWPKGIVTALHPGKDGKIRVVDIRTATSNYCRPIAKLAVLDVVKEDELPPREVIEEENVTEGRKETELKVGASGDSPEADATSTSFGGEKDRGGNLDSYVQAAHRSSPPSESSATTTESQQ